MGLLQLQYFKALAEREHLTQTAKHLMISAPSLSATIARLEREVGFQLFDRAGRNISLNGCGRIYLKYVNEVFSSLENAKLEMLDAESKHDLRLSLGITSPIIWHDAFQAFIKKNPHITISHTIIKQNMMENPSFCSQFDFVISATSDLPGGEWDYKTLWFDDKPLFAVYPNHPFAQQKAIRFIDAKDENFIALSKGFSSRKFFDDLCAKAGFSPKIIMECDYMLRSKMIASEYGIALTTESGSRTSALDNVVFVEIIDPGIRRTQAIIWNKRRHLSKTAILFRDFMVDYYDKEANPCL